MPTWSKNAFREIPTSDFCDASQPADASADGRLRTNRLKILSCTHMGAPGTRQHIIHQRTLAMTLLTLPRFRQETVELGRLGESGFLPLKQSYHI